MAFSSPNVFGGETLQGTGAEGAHALEEFGGLDFEGADFGGVDFELPDMDFDFDF